MCTVPLITLRISGQFERPVTCQLQRVWILREARGAIFQKAVAMVIVDETAVAQHQMWPLPTP